MFLNEAFGLENDLPDELGLIPSWSTMDSTPTPAQAPPPQTQQQQQPNLMIGPGPAQSVQNQQQPKFPMQNGEAQSHQQHTLVQVCERKQSKVNSAEGVDFGV